MTAATISNAEAIYPGYGFLENADFATMVEEHGITFIGPSPHHIREMGDKVAAKRACIAAGIPVVPGSDGAVADEEDARAIAERLGYPVLFKATAGGGGRGMKVVHEPQDLAAAIWNRHARNRWQPSATETSTSKKYLTRPRHIEVQILADAHGNVVHLGERDARCSAGTKR